jgi:hypothetical protein
VGPFDISVQEHDVVLHHDMDVWKIELLLDGPQGRSHAVRQRQVVDIGIWPPTEESVQQTPQATVSTRHSLRDVRGKCHHDRESCDEPDETLQHCRVLLLSE